MNMRLYANTIGIPSECINSFKEDTKYKLVPKTAHFLFQTDKKYPDKLIAILVGQNCTADEVHSNRASLTL